MQKIAILYDASQAVISTFDLDEVLARIISILKDYFQLKHIAVLLVDKNKKDLRVRTHLGWNAKSLETDLKVGTGLIGSAAHQKRPIYVPDVSKDERYIGTISVTRSELAIPLIVRDEVVGVLDCQSDQPNFFDAETIDLLILFSTQASIAIENARLYSLEERKASQLEAINLIARQTTAVLDVNELLEKVCTLVLQSFPVDHASILLVEDGQLVFRAHRGNLTPTFVEGQRVPESKGLSNQALATGRPVIVNDVSKVADYVLGFKETRAEVCIPLLSFG